MKRSDQIAHAIINAQAAVVAEAFAAGYRAAITQGENGCEDGMVERRSDAMREWLEEEV